MRNLIFKHFVTLLAVTQCLKLCISHCLKAAVQQKHGDGTFMEPDTIKNRPIGLWKMYDVKLLIDL